MKTYQEHLAAALLCLVVAAPAAAQAPAPTPAKPPILPGIGAEDRRAEVDQERAPWRSLVKIQTNLGGRCTGALIGRRMVLTAAHCLFNGRTRRYLPASSLHVLFGYARGSYSGHTTVTGFTVDPLHDPTRAMQGLASDWAMLRLAEEAPPDVPPLPLATSDPAAGSAVAFGGYSQDRAQIILADTACSLLGRAAVPGGQLLVHDCAGTRGTSGGALLAERGGAWEVVGIAVAAGSGAERRNFAVPVAVLPALPSAAPPGAPMGAGQP